MPRRPGKLALPVLALALMLCAPASALGAVRCVPLSNTAGCTSSHGTVQAAVTASTSGDTVRVAAGTYPESVNADTKTLTFEGAGSSTLIEPVAATTGPPALSVAHGGTVRSIRLVGGKSNGLGITGGDAVRFVSPGDFSLTLDGVVLGGGGTSGGGAQGGRGVELESTSAANDTRLTIAASSITGGDGNFGGPGVNAAASGGTIAIRDSSLLGGPGGGQAGPGAVVEAANATARADRSQFQGGNGVTVISSSFTAVRSRLIGTEVGGGATSASGSDAPASLTLIDSLLTASGEPGAVAAVYGGAHPVQLTATGSTFYGSHPGLGGIHAEATPSQPPVTATLHNSIVRIVDGQPGSADLHSDGATITADHSSFTTIGQLNGGTATAAGSGTNISGDPKFVSAADFSLQPTSPLIDRGDPAVVTAGELDLAGAARSLDGNGDCAAAPDIGAFERPALGCPANLAPAVSKFGATNKTFAPVKKGGKITAARKKRKRKVKRGTRFRYTLSEAAKVTITIERKLKGRRVKKGKRRVCAKPTRRNRKKRKCTRYKRAGSIRANAKAGSNRTGFTGRFRGKALKRGRYRATLVATDAQGAKSKPRRLSLRVVKP